MDAENAAAAAAAAARRSRKHQQTEDVPSSPSVMLSEYEIARAKNIERNNRRLRELGLISKLEELESNDVAWKRPPAARRIVDGTISSDNDRGDGDDDDEWKGRPEDGGEHDGSLASIIRCTKRRKKSREAPPAAPPSSPSRKSLRLRGLQPDGESRVEDDNVPLTSSANIPEQELRRLRVEECREARLRVAAKYAELGIEKAAKDNPTATYEHCLMRVRTMKPKALANRVKAIERAAGKHCVIKMVSCLVALVWFVSSPGRSPGWSILIPESSQRDSFSRSFADLPYLLSLFIYWSGDLQKLLAR